MPKELKASREDAKRFVIDASDLIKAGETEKNTRHKELELEKQKTLTILYSGSEVRFNPNHDNKGRFAPGHGSSGSTGGTSAGKGGGNSSGSSGGNQSFAKADEGTQSQHQKAVDELSKPKYEDGTYDVETLQPVSYSDGFQVTFCQIGDNYSSKEYADKVNEFLAASSDGKTLAGKFEGSPEVSFHVSDMAKAVELAKKYNQISVWDWQNECEIKTGGSGRR